MTQKTAKDIREMFDSIAPRYELANDVLSFGRHHAWAKKAISLLNPAPLALDLCTGTGALIPELLTKFGKVVGADFSSEMLAIAKEKFINDSRVRLIEADALALPFPGGYFDAVTMAYGIRNLVDYEQGLKEIYRVLKARGQFLVLEFGQPAHPIKMFYSFYAKFLMPIIGGLLTGNKKAYEYLPKTAKEFPSGKAFEDILENAGFNCERVVPLFWGIAYIYWVRKP